LGGLWGAFRDAGVGFLQGILSFFQSHTGSYGLAIILLTIAVRLLLYPLSQKQMVSMTQMQKIQPRLKHLQEKYADDKQTLQQEMMRLYKENNVNPLAGCFPILIQIPIMILLFQALMKYEVADSIFFGIRLERSVLYGIADALSILPADGQGVGITAVMRGIFDNPSGLLRPGLYLPGVLLMIFIVFLTWFQQKISGATNNPQMASMNVIMPLMMGFFCLTLPGGVLVYWGTSSLIGILQQWFVMRKAKELMAVKPVLHKNKPLPGKQAQGAATLDADDEDDEDDEDYEDEYDDDEYEDDEEEDDDDDDDRGEVK
jgi:YidC/Oxa1 family membrane protein insertase